MSNPASMSVTLRLPARLFYEGAAVKLAARAGNGAFGILPDHIDFATALVPSVLMLTAPDDEELVFGIDEGIMVKRGRQVDICVRRAARGTTLASLETIVRDTFIDLDDKERTARSALSRLEADMVRRFMELRERRQ
ncbi:MAG: F0F1 ATP synthase subunit epsilon [Sneathiella sp.]|nr:F0F1 ATP synthase subunit epsilon [Sneathiella sp.]